MHNINQFVTPILFLVFNRSETTKVVFERIKSIKPKYLYIASDGPREFVVGEDLLVKNVRDWVLENIDWDCEIKTLFRSKNLGCGVAVASAIDWFFQNEEMGIIIEDDCLVSKSFFNYCEELLIKYRSCPEIVSICSSNSIGYKSDLFSYSFSRYSLIWGWATWRRAWFNYDFDIKHWPLLKSNDWLKSLNDSPKFNSYWSHVFDTCYNKEVNTWDFQWNFASFLNGGISIIPNVNMVRNIGIGINETHKVDKHFMDFVDNEIDFPLIHPNVIELNSEIDNLLDFKIFSLTRLEYVLIQLKKIPMFKGIIKCFKILFK